MRWLACLATTLFAGLGHAAALVPDPTGLWFDPAESGWGVGLAQQGDTVFATLFVYDDAHRPAWYVASSMKDDGRETFVAAPPVFVGTLYRTSGPVFSGPFDPKAVTSAAVGTISGTYTDFGGTRLVLQYTIDGVQVSKTLQRQAWGDNSLALVGRFSGGAVITTAATAACPGINFSPPSGVPFGLSIASGPLAGELRFTWGTGIDTLCSIDGTYAQQGQLGSVSGTLGCAPIGFTLPRDITARVTQLTGNADGFAGALTLQQGACTYSGHIGGVRLP